MPCLFFHFEFNKRIRKFDRNGMLYHAYIVCFIRFFYEHGFSLLRSISLLISIFSSFHSSLRLYTHTNSPTQSNGFHCFATKSIIINDSTIFMNIHNMKWRCMLKNNVCKTFNRFFCGFSFFFSNESIHLFCSIISGIITSIWHGWSFLFIIHWHNKYSIYIALDYIDAIAAGEPCDFYGF